MLNMLKKKELWKGARKTAENIRDAVDKEIKLQYDKLTGENRSKSTKRKAKKRPLETVKQPKPVQTKPVQPKPVQVTSTAVKTQRQSQKVKTSVQNVKAKQPSSLGCATVCGKGVKQNYCGVWKQVKVE